MTFLGNVTVSDLDTLASAYPVDFQGTANVVDTDTNFLNTGAVTFGNAGTDSMTFTGGLDTTTGPSGTNIAGAVVTTDSQIDLGFLTLTANSTLDAGMSGINLQNNGNLGANNLDLTAGGAITSGGVISGIGGSLTKGGLGAFTLSGMNTYTGPTAVNAGTLLVDGSITSDVTINAGTLGGDGIITGDVTANIATTIAPGGSPGVLTINGDVAFANGSTFFVELDGGLPAEFDQLVVDGTVDLANATLDGTVGFTSSGAFRIIDNQAQTPVMGRFASGATVDLSGNSFTIDYTGGTGNDIVLASAGTDLAEALPHPVPQVLAELIPHVEPTLEVTLKTSVGPGVEMVRLGERLQLRPGTALRPGDEIQTRPDTFATLSLGESELILFPDTRIRIGSLSLDMGKVFLRIRGAFTLKAEDINAGATETEIFVERDANEFALTVLSGRAYLAPSRQNWERVWLNQFERASVTGEQPPHVRHLDSEQIDTIRQSVHEAQKRVSMTERMGARG